MDCRLCLVQSYKVTGLNWSEFSPDSFKCLFQEVTLSEVQASV